MTNRPQIAANVMLCSNSINTLHPADITASNIKQLLPTETAMASVCNYFSKKGFSMLACNGPLVTLSGDVALFERIFGIPLTIKTKNNIILSTTTAKGDYELPMDAIPVGIRRFIASIGLDQWSF